MDDGRSGEREHVEHQSLDAESLRYAHELVDRLKQVLGTKLLGVYLHGSGALGDFTPSRSDIDIVAVASGGLSDEECSRLRDELSPTALPCPATGLEFHVVSAKTLDLATDAPPFEVHFAAESREGSESFVDGRRRKGDADLAMHYAVLKTHGVRLAGPSASDVFPEVPRDLMLRALREELQWAIAHGSPSYQVLNAARAWRFLEEGVICSKTEGGRWARTRVSDPSPIEIALKHRRGMSNDHPNAEQARLLVDDVCRRLDASSEV